MIFRILIVVVDNDLASFINRGKERIIPVEWLREKYFQERGASLTTSAFVISHNRRDLHNEIIRLRQRAEGVILIYQQEASSEAKSFSKSCFVRALETGGNVSNMLARNIAAVLREFVSFSKFFDEMKYKQLFLLPFNNFSAGDFASLCSLLADGGKEFANTLPQLISNLKRHQQPKRLSRSPAA